MRHTAIYDPQKYAGERVAVIGVGTIGSHLALTLARMQVPLTLYDHDTIEAHNLATQAYGLRDIGKYKVDAVRSMCEDLGAEPDSVRGIPTLFTAELIDQYTTVISCVDSIEARQDIGEALNNVSYLGSIHDGRVGAEQVEVYHYGQALGVLRPCLSWLAALPETADTDPCGARFTAYTANIAAGLLANNIKRELLGQTVKPRILYDAASSSFLCPSA